MPHTYVLVDSQKWVVNKRNCKWSSLYCGMCRVSFPEVEAQINFSIF
jgi:hypothetical protein